MSNSSSCSDDSDELAPTKIIEQQLVEQNLLDSFAGRLANEDEGCLIGWSTSAALCS